MYLLRREQSVWCRPSVDTACQLLSTCPNDTHMLHVPFVSSGATSNLAQPWYPQLVSEPPQLQRGRKEETECVLLTSFQLRVRHLFARCITTCPPVSDNPVLDTCWLVLCIPCLCDCPTFHDNGVVSLHRFVPVSSRFRTVLQPPYASLVIRQSVGCEIEIDQD